MIVNVRREGYDIKRLLHVISGTQCHVQNFGKGNTGKAI